jgi:hypothetical protein
MERHAVGDLDAGDCLASEFSRFVLPVVHDPV